MMVVLLWAHTTTSCLKIRAVGERKTESVSVCMCVCAKLLTDGELDFSVLTSTRNDSGRSCKTMRSRAGGSAAGTLRGRRALAWRRSLAWLALKASEELFARKNKRGEDSFPPRHCEYRERVCWWWWGGGSSSRSSGASVVAPRSLQVQSPGSLLSGSAVGGLQSQASGSVALASVAPVAPPTGCNETKRYWVNLWLNLEHTAFKPHKDKEGKEPTLPRWIQQQLPQNLPEPRICTERKPVAKVTLASLC